jgi:acetaldehyde dehydrogenase (acetylating)
MQTLAETGHPGRVKAAILGPGNIGTDLLMKLRRRGRIEVVLVAGIIPDSPGLSRARELGIDTTDEGLDGVLVRDDIALVFDATSARAHAESAPRLREAGKRVVDLTPAAVGPYVVPTVNLDQHLDAVNVNMISCGGQATIPIVHAISRVTPIRYAEIVATIASASAGQGTRQNIDEFTETTARAIESLGAARSAKAIIVLNPAEPPMLMRDTIYAEVDEINEPTLRASVEEMIEDLRSYVPGYRLVLFEATGDLVTVMVEIEGSGDFLPRYSGNLDIMTAAAARVGERLAERIAAQGRVHA